MVAYDDKVMVPGTQMYEMFGPQSCCPNCSYPDNAVHWQDVEEDLHHQRVRCEICDEKYMQMDAVQLKWGDAMKEHHERLAEWDEEDRRYEQTRKAKTFHDQWAKAFLAKRTELNRKKRIIQQRRRKQHGQRQDAQSA